MKIGVFIDGVHQLNNWQRRIVYKIMEDATMNLSLIIEKTDSENSKHNFLAVNSAICKSRFSIGATLLNWQHSLERNILFTPKESVAFSEVKPSLLRIKNIKLPTGNKNNSWSYNEAHLLQIQELGIDLLLNLSSNVLTGNLVSVPKFGAWALMHKDSKLNKNAPVGFAEVLYRKPVIGCSLLKLASEPQANQIIDTAFFNRHWSMVETANTAYEGSVSLLFKHLNVLVNENTLHIFKGSYAIPKSFAPNVYYVIGYLFQFYRAFFYKVFEKFATKVLKKRQECWTIFTGEKGFFNQVTDYATALTMPNNQFWADPFLFDFKGVNYVFFENYDYNTKKGIISCGVLKDKQLTEVKDILVKEYHLSFPYIFMEDDEVYMMPETSANKRLEIYKAVDFPDTWELCVTAFEGESVADAFFHTDDNNQKWLFLNKQMDAAAPMNSELYIYKVDSFKLTHIQPHAHNPVMIDARVARNGGSIFKENNVYFRPSQRNEDGVYGRSLNINRIEKLSLTEYKEQTVTIIKPDFDKRLIGLHHLHRVGNRFVFDAAYRMK